MLNYLYIYPETIVDGEGIRYSIYLAGCRHCCKGCHNPESWNEKAGNPLTDEKIAEIIKEINSNPLLDGITFSGGDPLFNPEEFRKVSGIIKKLTKKEIWCYTGYTFEQIKADNMLISAIEYVNVLVEGPFISSLANPTLEYRGSSNQRIIRVR